MRLHRGYKLKKNVTTWEQKHACSFSTKLLEMFLCTEQYSTVYMKIFFPLGRLTLYKK